MTEAVLPRIHTVAPEPGEDLVRALLDEVDTSGFYDPRPDIEVWLHVMHAFGIDDVPEAYREDVLDAEIERLSDEKHGFSYFLRHYGMVRIKGGKDRGWRRLCPGGDPRTSEVTGRDWGWQLALADAICEFDVFLVLKARQIGLTFIAAHYALWRCMFFNDSVGIVIANKQTTSERLVRRVRDIYRHLPEGIKAHAVMVNDGIRRLEFANGSSLEPMSAAADTGRSEAASFVLIDETANIRPIPRQEQVWGSVEACADGGGKILMFTTANGVGDLVHSWVTDSAFGEVTDILRLDNPDGQLDIEVMFGDAEMGFTFLPWFLHPDRDEKWMARKRKMYRGSLSQLEQEYPSSWQQAFIASGLTYFDIIALEEMANANRLVAEQRDLRVSLVWSDKSRLLVKAEPDPYGAVVIHGIEDLIEALKTNRPFVIGADAAGDDPWGDYQAASALHVGRAFFDMAEEVLLPTEALIPHRQLVTLHGQMPADVYAENLCKLGYFLGGARIAVEANGVGTAVISQLKTKRYPKLYYRRNSPLSREHKVTDRAGFWSDAATKNLAYGLVDKYQRLGVLDVRDTETLNEERNVVHLGGQRIGAPEPNHDDRVSGLAIATMLARTEASVMAIGSVEVKTEIEAVLEEIAEETRGDDVALGNEMYWRK